MNQTTLPPAVPRPPPLYEVLYTSQLAQGERVNVLADIIAVARERNATSGLTGLLVFDGQRFVQQLEGARHAVLSCVERIRSDARHREFEILHHGGLPARRFRRFAMGYAEADDGALTDLATNPGPYATERLQTLLTSLELDP